MPGIFKKLNASDAKITPFEAHKQYNTVDLTSIGASTSSLAWSGKNKSEFTDSNIKYYQLNKLYYRNYIQERAHRLELDDATYTTQERRLYEKASLISLSQKTFGSEVQPNSFELSGSKSALQFYFKDDGFGNLYDVNLGKDNFPNEDNRVFYLAPVNAFKRADLTLDYETGNKYVNSPFSNSYSRTLYDDSYFLNTLTYTNVDFIKGLNDSTSEPQFQIGQAVVGTSVVADIIDVYGIKSSNSDSLIQIDHQPYLNFNKDESFTITFFYDPTAQDMLNADLGQVDKITFPFTNLNTSSLEHNSADGGRRILITNNSGDEFYLAFSGSGYVAPTSATGSATLVKCDLVNFDTNNDGVLTAESLAYSVRNILGGISNIVPVPDSFDLTSGEVAFGTSITPSLALPFQTDISSSLGITTASLSTITIAPSASDHYILSKEGTKTAVTLPSEGTQHTSLSTSGSSQIGTEPVGPQFPYRIFYRVGESPNSASLHFERSDGDATQVVSCSFFGGVNSNNSSRRHVTAMAETDSKISLEIKGNTISATTQDSTTQGSPILTNHCTNQANVTLFAKSNPDGTYTNGLNTGAGQISQLMIWNKNLSTAELNNVHDSITGTYPVGNLFYDNGFAAITHPKYMNIFNNDSISNNLKTLKYKNTHLITENEYQCTMNENEFEFTRNVSARKIPTSENEDIANFATGSNFKPYITTIGLYDDNANLLMVGKLAQPVRASSETDTTFIIRYDT